MTAGLFCEHKRLRTGCPQCKATAVPRPAPEVTRYVSTDERLEREEKRATRETAARSANPAAPAEPKEASGPKRRGPGNPLMPTRAKKRGVSADEAAAAKPWWVKK